MRRKDGMRKETMKARREEDLRERFFKRFFKEFIKPPIELGIGNNVRYDYMHNTIDLSN